MSVTGGTKLYLRRLSYIVMAFALSLVFTGVTFQKHASAGTLTRAVVRLDSLVAGATSVSGRACFISDQTVTSVKSVRITFPTTNAATDYTLGAAANFSTNTSNLDTVPTAQSAFTGVGATASNVTGKAVTFDNSTGIVPGSGTEYCFNWSGTGLTNPTAWTTESAPGTLETFSAIGASGLLSTSSFSLPKTVTTNGTNVGVTATIPPSFSFTLSGTTDPFGTINLAAVNFTTGLTGTVVTNAGSGWIIWARSTGNASCAKGCIYSPSKAYGIKSAAAVGSAAANIATGAEHYDFATTAKNLGPSGSCTAITQTTYFDGITNAGWGGPLDKTALYPIASCDGSSTSATVSFREALVAIASTPAASDYADTIIMTAAGRF